MAKINWQIEIELGEDTEKDFINQIISEREGDAIQTLAGGKLRDWENVTDQQKKDYALKAIGEQYSLAYQNASDEKKTQAFRKSLQDARLPK